MGKEVAITGLGVVSALGTDVDTFFRNLVEGNSGVDTIERYDLSQHQSQIGAEVPTSFDPYSYFPQYKKDIKHRMGRSSRYAIVAAAQALEDAGLFEDGYRPEEASVLIGAGNADGQVIEDNQKKLSLGPARVSTYLIPAAMPNAPASYISQLCNMQDYAGGITTACASGNDAILTAYKQIIDEDEDTTIALAGGTEAPITELVNAGFSKARSMSTRNNAPQQASRPFDTDRDGFVIGEGSGVVLLEDMDRARQRGAHIYAILAGGGWSADAYHATAPHPEGRGALKATEKVLRKTGLTPEEIDYINAHGTGTALNDPVEINAAYRVFDRHLYDISISSTKSTTGHLMGGAGGIEGVATTLAIYHGVIPPTINLDHIDEDCGPDLDHVRYEAKERNITAALSNAFGFGGHNSVLALRAFDQ